MNDMSCRATSRRRRAETQARRRPAPRARREAAAGSGPLLRASLLPLVALLFAPAVGALPVGALVVNGSVAVGAPVGGAMAITQTTPQAIVNWNGFSIAGGESVNILQPSASAVMLNRVVGSSASVIAGHLSANGHVFLVNPAGVMFSSSATVDVGSLVASTLGIGNQDFLAGNYHFVNAVGQTGGKVVNQGAIQAGSGGTIALLGGQVGNSGVVTATLGTVALGAGSDITLDFAGDGLTMLHINGAAAQALLGNSGTLAADGGQVLMSVQSADTLAGTVLNQTGTVRAQSIAERNGRIVLDGGPNGVTQVTGLVDATGAPALTGGQIDITGQDVALLAGAQVDASGAAGGGRVRFGGGAGGADADLRDAQAVWMASTAQLRANALVNGPGGQLFVYGIDAARLYGGLSAKGGPAGGNGGTIETAAQYLDLAGATVNASAPDGKGGNWIIEPAGATVVDTSSLEPVVPGPVTFSPEPGTSLIANGQIDALLNAGGAVTINAGPVSGPPGNGAGFIALNAPVVKTIGGAASLTLSAASTIVNGASTGIVDQPALGTTPGAVGPLNITMQANVGNTVTGGNATILLGGSTETPFVLQSNGGNIVIGSLPPLATLSGASVALVGPMTIDTRVYTAAGTPSVTAPSGAVTIQASVDVGDGVDLDNTTINTTTGPILIQGQASTALGERNYALGSGVDLIRSTLATTTGAIDIVGAAPTAANALRLEGDGVDIGNSTITSVTGPVTIQGVGPTAAAGVDTEASNGVSISSMTLSTAGAIDIQGTTSATNVAGIGIDFGDDENGPTHISGGVGGIRIFGRGNGDEGVLIESPGEVVTAAGPIDVRGLTDGRLLPADGNVLAPGVSITGGSISATGPGQTVSITGFAPSTAYGLVLTGTSISAGEGGTIILRAANLSTTSSPLSVDASSALSTDNGSLVLVPGSLNATTFAIIPGNATPINFISNGAGFSIGQALLAAVAPDVSTIILGSTTQTGRITIDGACATLGNLCTPIRPTFTTSLTLANPGAGSEGIALPFGVAMPGKTLTLSSAGPVTDSGGIVAAGLMLAGPGTFTLTDPDNNVGTLSMVEAGNVVFSNPGSFRIGPLISRTYDSSAGHVVELNGTSSTVTGNLLATSQDGGIVLGAPGVATGIKVGGVDNLVMESGVFTNLGGGSLSAGNAWHIWAASWQGETRGGIDPGGAQPDFYGCTFTGGCSWGGVVPLAFNHFVYAAQPTLTVSADGKTRPAGSPNPPLTFTVVGLINGDTSGGSVSGSLSTPATLDSPVGRYCIDGVFSSPVGYTVTVVPGTLTVVSSVHPWRPWSPWHRWHSWRRGDSWRAWRAWHPRDFDRSGSQSLFTAAE